MNERTQTATALDTDTGGHARVNEYKPRPHLAEHEPSQSADSRETRASQATGIQKITVAHARLTIQSVPARGPLQAIGGAKTACVVAANTAYFSA